jgi:hypothetical protein
MRADDPRFEAVPPPDEPPGQAFDPWQELKWSISELHAMAAQLGSHLHADEDTPYWATADRQTWSALDLLERCLADVGTLAAQYVRMRIADRYGRDPLA